MAVECTADRRLRNQRIALPTQVDQLLPIRIEFQRRGNAAQLHAQQTRAAPHDVLRRHHGDVWPSGGEGLCRNVNRAVRAAIYVNDVDVIRVVNRAEQPLELARIAVCGDEVR